MKPKSTFIPPYVLKASPSFLKIHALLFDNVYTLGGPNFVNSVIEANAAGNENCTEALRSILKPVDNSLDPTLNADRRQDFMFAGSEKNFDDPVYKRTFDITYQYAKMINPYSDDPWDGEVLATLCCKPTAGICQSFFHHLCTVDRICRHYDAALVVSEPWEFQEYRVFAPSVMSQQGVYFETLVETQIPSFIETPWQRILELRRNSHLPLFRKWLDELSEDEFPDLKEDVWIRLKSIIEESLWNAVAALGISPLATGAKGVLGNLPSPIFVNPFGIAAAVLDTRKALLTRNALGWLVYLNAIRSSAPKEADRRTPQESCSLPIAGYVSSKRHKTYHRSWCQTARKITRNNLQTWDWEMNAKKAGLRSCEYCLLKFRKAEGEV